MLALVPDVMDRSRIAAAGVAVTFARAVPELGDPDDPPDVVVLDLARHRGDVTAVRQAFPHARIVAFAPHVDTSGADAAELGVDVVLARSRFFRDPRAALSTGAE